MNSRVVLVSIFLSLNFSMGAMSISKIKEAFSKNLTNEAQYVMAISTVLQVLSSYMSNGESIPALIENSSSPNMTRLGLVFGAFTIPAIYLKALHNTPALWNKNLLLLAFMQALSIGSIISGVQALSHSH